MNFLNRIMFLSLNQSVFREKASIIDTNDETIDGVSRPLDSTLISNCVLIVSKKAFDTVHRKLFTDNCPANGQRRTILTFCCNISLGDNNICPSNIESLSNVISSVG